MYTRLMQPALVIAAIAAVVPVIGLFGALAVAPLLAIAAVALLALGGWRRPATYGRVLSKPQWAVLGAFFLWLSLSSLWSPDPLFALRSAAMTAGSIAGGIVLLGAGGELDGAGRQRVLAALTGGLTMAAAILFLIGVFETITVPPTAEDPFGAYPIVQRMDRGATLLALLVWPAVCGQIALGRQRRAWLLAALVALACAFSHDLAAKVAVFLGFLAVLVTGRWPRAAALVLSGLIALVLMLSPIAAARLPDPEVSITWKGLPRSAHHRLTIWRFAESKIVERPWTGWGLEASRWLGDKQERHFTTLKGVPFVEELMPLHPHNAALQIWLELGAVGAAAAAAFILTIGWRLGGVPPGWGAQGVVASLATAAFISGVSYGFWQSWWQCSLWLGAALAACRVDGGPR